MKHGLILLLFELCTVLCIFPQGVLQEFVVEKENNPKKENGGVTDLYEQNDIADKQTDSQTNWNNEIVKDSTVNNYSNPDNDNLLDMEDYTSFIAWNSANTCYREGDYAKAIEYYQKVTIKNRPSAVWKNIGICYQRLNMYDDAIEYFSKCNDGSAWYSMGLCYKEKNNYSKMIECMKKAAQLGHEDAQNLLRGMNKK